MVTNTHNLDDKDLKEFLSCLYKKYTVNKQVITTETLCKAIEESFIRGLKFAESKNNNCCKQLLQTHTL